MKRALILTYIVLMSLSLLVCNQDRVYGYFPPAERTLRLLNERVTLDDGIFVDGFAGVWMSNHNRVINIGITEEFITDISDLSVVIHEVRFSLVELTEVFEFFADLGTYWKNAIIHGAGVSIMQNNVNIHLISDEYLDYFKSLAKTMEFPEGIVVFEVQEMAQFFPGTSDERSFITKKLNALLNWITSLIF